MTIDLAIAGILLGLTVGLLATKIRAPPWEAALLAGGLMLIIMIIAGASQ